MVSRSKHLQNLVDEIQARRTSGLPSSDVIRMALRCAEEQYRRDGIIPKPVDLWYSAFVGACAVSLQDPFGMADLPLGTDKTSHFFVTGTLVFGTYKRLWWLPKQTRIDWSVGIALWTGRMKETLDLMSSGYNNLDMRANTMGAEAALALLKTL